MQTVPENSAFSYLAVIHELNDREFRRKLGLFPEEMRYYVILAGGIVGSENAKRVKETPEAVVLDGEEFVDDLMQTVPPGREEGFREVLETFLLETLKDELKFSCANCRWFNKCLDLNSLTVGELFGRRVKGDDDPELKSEIARQISVALSRTPYQDSNEAHRRCVDFTHQYSVSNLGAVMGRYADIAASLERQYGINYRKVQQHMISINLEFCEKLGACNC